MGSAVRFHMQAVCGAEEVSERGPRGGRARRGRVSGVGQWGRRGQCSAEWGGAGHFPAAGMLFGASRRRARFPPAVTAALLPLPIHSPRCAPARRRKLHQELDFRVEARNGGIDCIGKKKWGFGGLGAWGKGLRRVLPSTRGVQPAGQLPHRARPPTPLPQRPCRPPLLTACSGAAGGVHEGAAGRGGATAAASALRQEGACHGICGGVQGELASSLRGAFRL